MSLRYVERGKKDTAVLIPGWATDYRIFDSLDIEFNYLLPLEFSPFGFEKSLLSALKEYKICKISLWGWSLGGFWAAKFAAKYASLLDELILVSIRKKYKAQEIAGMELRLKKNREECLYQFYRRCFYGENGWQRFRDNLLESYLQELNLDYLFTTLGYLKAQELNPQALKEIRKIKIIHGEFDRIAPSEEARDIKRNLPQAKFISIRDAGHIPFLETDFNKYV